MDNISEFDIKLEKDVYYAGEVMRGHVMLHTTENFKLRCKIRNQCLFVSFFNFVSYIDVVANFGSNCFLATKRPVLWFMNLILIFTFKIIGWFACTISFAKSYELCYV